MIRAFLIDDEPLALRHLEKVLKELMDIDIIGTFTDPLEAVEAVGDSKPDVIFLDIDMPEINGLQAMDMIQDICPAAEFVFVTAYNQYALEAFELSALDYILKPLQRSRMMKTVNRLEARLSLVAAKAPEQECRTVIRCFRMLQFEHEGQPPQALRWRTTKTEELFAYLLQHRTEIVYREKIIDMLWPEADYKKATAHLYTLIYQLRKTLKQSNIDVRICKISGKEGYVLEPQNVRIDTDVWEMGIRELGSVEQHNYAEHHSLIDQYSGDYLGVYDYIWAESERQRLRTIWLHHAMQVAKFYTRNNMLAEAVTVYQRIVQLQPYSEEGNLGLMKIYDRMGQPSLVVMQFRTLQQMLKEELGIGLSENVRSWYEIWVAGNK